MSALSRIEIRRIEIRNFQSHRHTVIEPAPAGGLTVIVGPSDSGKTAVLRALKWLLYNQPQGDGFKRVGCDFVEVEIETADGHVVERRRTASTNRYATDNQVFEGFGTSVPVEVQKITGVFPIRLGDQEILANLAGQLEAPFLGSSISGPARAKALGKLAGIEVIDRALRDLAGDVHRTRTEKSRLETELERLDGEIARYAHLPALAARIEQLRTISVRIETAYERWNALNEARGRLQMINTQIDEARRRLTAIGDVEGAAQALERAAAASERRSRLADAARSLGQASESVRSAVAALARVRQVDQAASIVAHVAQLAARFDTLRAAQSELAAATKQIETTRARMRRAEAVIAVHSLLDGIVARVDRRCQLVEIRHSLTLADETENGAREFARDAKAKIDEAVSEYAAVLTESGTCPTCGQMISDSIHSHIQEVLAS